MTLHDRVSEVLGFEMVESAVADAQLNAERNALSRCEFIVGKAEVSRPAREYEYSSRTDSTVRLGHLGPFNPAAFRETSQRPSHLRC